MVLVAGVGAPAFDEARRLYRQPLFHGFMNFLSPGDGIQSEEYNATMGERFATAIVDLDGFAALEIAGGC